MSSCLCGSLLFRVFCDTLLRGNDDGIFQATASLTTQLPLGPSLPRLPGSGRTKIGKLLQDNAQIINVTVCKVATDHQPAVKYRTASPCPFAVVQLKSQKFPSPVKQWPLDYNQVRSFPGANCVDGKIDDIIRSSWFVRAFASYAGRTVPSNDPQGMISPIGLTEAIFVRKRLAAAYASFP